MAGHECVFEVDATGRLPEDAVCPGCGSTIMDGYLLPIETESSSNAGREE